jgi:methionyl-tRNA formyltransferase
LQPEKASDPLFLQEIKSLEADLVVVVAYGQILKESLLQTPPLGAINLHASLLPKYRGAAPVQRALMQGEEITGVVIQKMVKELDAGDVLREALMAIPSSMNAGELLQELCLLAKPLLLHFLQEIGEDLPEGRAQDPSLVTMAPKIQPEETRIVWGRPSVVIHNQVRGLAPTPGAWSWMQTRGMRKKIKIISTELSQETLTMSPGTISRQGLVGCGSGAPLRLIKVQPEGKVVMDVGSWLRGQVDPVVLA